MKRLSLCFNCLQQISVSRMLSLYFEIPFLLKDAIKEMFFAAVSLGFAGLLMGKEKDLAFE